MLGNVSKIPFRFFGPLDDRDSEQLVEIILDDNDLRDTLVRFLRGDIEPRELSYEIQIIAEGNWERIQNANSDEKRDHSDEHEQAGHSG